MAEARRKRQRFLAQHPLCCFWGGSVNATTIDHIPSQDCFRNRAFPEGFEFPACDHCQAATRGDEQVFSFVVQMGDRSQDNYDSTRAKRAIMGIRNNFPHLYPKTVDDPFETAKALHHMGHAMPMLPPPTRVPIVALPVEIAPHIDRVSKKLLLAIYYKETGRIARPGYRIWSTWSFASDLHSMKAVVEVAQMTRFQTVGWRRNLEFGKQFGYRWDRSEEGDPHDLFMLVAQFGEGLVVTANLIDDTSFRELGPEDDPDDWISVASLVGARGQLASA